MQMHPGDGAGSADAPHHEGTAIWQPATAVPVAECPLFSRPTGVAARKIMAMALEQFVKQIEDSGVIAPGRLENFVPPKAHPKDAQELARQLVQTKQLTKFQAQEIYHGRAK